MRASAPATTRHFRYWRRPSGRLLLWLPPKSLARMYSLLAWLRFLGRFPCGQECSRLPQSLGRPDLVEPLLHFKRRQLLAPQKIRIQLSQIARLSLWQTLECFAAKDSQPVIDITHARSAVGLAVRQDLSSFDPVALKLDVAGIPFPFVAKGGHHSQHICSLKLLGYRSVVARKIGVAVHDKKRTA